MDRPPHEPPAVYEEYPTVSRLTDAIGTPRLWKMPVPLRVKHSSFKIAGVKAPVPPGRTGIFTLPVRGKPTLLTFPGSRHWLVLTVSIPDGSTPTDPFASEDLPFHRVDGESCKGYLTVSSKGLVYMAGIDLTRATLSSMTARILDREPDSRILVRLLPRYARGSLRWFPSLGCFQFWSAL
jgi:hypothetical protein